MATGRPVNPLGTKCWLTCIKGISLRYNLLYYQKVRKFCVVSGLIPIDFGQNLSSRKPDNFAKRLLKERRRIAESCNVGITRIGSADACGRKADSRIKGCERQRCLERRAQTGEHSP